MSERIWAWDQARLDASKIERFTHNVYGPITRFKDAVIAREIIHEYDDGRAYKSAKELEDYAWTVEGRWAHAGGHPKTGVIMNRDEINGRTVNARFSKSLKDPKTKRPNNRGVLVDLDIFENRTAPPMLQDMLSGKLQDLSIGFWFSKDEIAGTIEEDGHPLRGQSYDYVQRHLMHDHMAFAIDSGRCPMPFCGIGADQVFAKDPEQTENYVRIPVNTGCKVTATISISKEKGINALYCGKEKQIHTYIFMKKKGWNMEKAKSWVSQHSSSDLMSELVKDMTVEEIKQFLPTLIERVEEFDKTRTEAQRAMSHFNITPEEWEKLSDEEKQEHVDKLPDRESTDEWWRKMDWNAVPEVFYALPDEAKDAIFDAGLWECSDCEVIEATDATEAEKAAAKKRCAKYPVSFKEGKGHVTKPKEYADVPEGQFADPCNFKYPYTEKYVMAAWAYISKPANKSKGGYSDAEWSWMRGRVKAAMKRHGHEVSEEKDEVLKKADEAIERSKKVL